MSAMEYDEAVVIFEQCEKCGSKYQIGQNPFCKGGHGWGATPIQASGEVISKHLGGKTPMRFGSRREEDKYLASKNYVRIADTPITEGERNAFERARERDARHKEGRPDKINPLHESEIP